MIYRPTGLKEAVTDGEAWPHSDSAFRGVHRPNGQSPFAGPRAGRREISTSKFRPLFRPHSRAQARRGEGTSEIAADLVNRRS